MEAGNAGHEAVGTVAALGEGVTGLRLGQRVGASAIAGCGHCAYCDEGQYTWCPNRTFYGSMHAERFLASANACYPLPDDVSWEAGVLLTGDGLGVPYHTARKLAPETETVAVFGVGPIGLGNVLMQSHLGRRVIAVDLAAERLEMARRLGASEVVDGAAGDAAEQVRALTGGVGADVCIEAAGRPETALACFAAVRTAGMVVFNGEQGEVPLSPSSALYPARYHGGGIVVLSFRRDRAHDRAVSQWLARPRPDLASLPVRSGGRGVRAVCRQGDGQGDFGVGKRGIGGLGTGVPTAESRNLGCRPPGSDVEEDKAWSYELPARKSR